MSVLPEHIVEFTDVVYLFSTYLLLLEQDTKRDKIVTNEMFFKKIKFSLKHLIPLACLLRMVNFDMAE